MMNLQLPSYQDIGQVRRWYLPLPRRVDTPAAVPSVGPVAVDARDVDVDVVQDVDADQVDVEYFRTAARFIGYSSSWTDNHWGHREEFVPQGSRCNACRWFELRIFRELGVDLQEIPSEAHLLTLYQRERRARALGGYVVYKTGMSIVPGEIPYCRVDEITSPHEVVEALTTRKHTDEGPVAFITKPSALALASGARFDDDLENAYINRAVS